MGGIFPESFFFVASLAWWRILEKYLVPSAMLWVKVTR